MLKHVFLEADAARLELPAVDISLELCAEFAPEGGEAAGKKPWCEDNATDVAETASEAREAQGIGFDLQHVAVFFTEGAVAEEGGEAKVEELGQVVGCSCVVVCKAGAEEGAQDGGGVGREGGGYVGVFVVSAEDVWGGSEGVFHWCLSSGSSCRHGGKR